jgi:trans-AT polyketide synthase, acyltransferase and oxidoreductase domains
VTKVEVSAFMQITPSLIRYKAQGIEKNNGTANTKNKIIAKVSRPEIAEQFMSPAPEKIIQGLLEQDKIDAMQAELLKKIPVADDICVEADSGGHTDRGVASVLMPAMLRLRDDMMSKYNYAKKICIGAAGGISTPQSMASAFILGADFVVTGSVNQCTVEAATSDLAKELLQQMNVQDTDYAPAGDMFELGAKVQVLKRGLFFAARANKLYELYRQHDSLSSIDLKIRQQIQDKYFNRTFEEVYNDVKDFFSEVDPNQIEKAEKNEKHKMALIFRWYFNYATELALNGISGQKVNFQIHCGSSLGAFNQYVKGSGLEDWRNRHVDIIADKLLNDTATYLNSRYSKFHA